MYGILVSANKQSREKERVGIWADLIYSMVQHVRVRMVVLPQNQSRQSIPNDHRISQSIGMTAGYRKDLRAFYRTQRQ